ncbi:hypothetical protein FHS27_001935 [Rhodopirellula rubra]|uniref:Uncharacterized protein n=1 Tax=Aporhodopirellula rubra TaxID=980271 RepID=A0A7W5DXS0_9BACT|nr:hypothetical protein [Aporhodopirellula rubra]
MTLFDASVDKMVDGDWHSLQTHLVCWNAPLFLKLFYQKSRFRL